jgi:hypothetical protein
MPPVMNKKALLVSMLLLLSPVAAEDFSERFSAEEFSPPLPEVPKTVFWHDYCRLYAFDLRASESDKNPGPEHFNQKPWIPYCEGYFEGLWDTMVLMGAICPPEGTKVYEITGSVHVEFQKSSESDRQVPPVVPMSTWLRKFPCKKDKPDEPSH